MAKAAVAEVEAPVVPPVPQIYEALVAVAAELSKMGVAKTRTNDQQHFRFRGIDDVMNAVSAILPKHRVVFLPHYDDHTTVDRPTRDGQKSLIYATVRGEYTFVSAADGSEVGVSTFGEAMDSGDKALNKAMSAALKYALLQTFLIPTESNEDADATTPEETRPAPPDGFAEWFPALLAISDEGFSRFMATWSKGNQPSREYAVADQKDDLTKAKQHANDVSAELEAQAAPVEVPEA